MPFGDPGPHVYTWDPNSLHVSIAAPTMMLPRVSGFAPGTALQVAMATARFQRIDGIRGQNDRIRLGSRAGSIAFVLEERSWVNQFLDALHALDDTLGSGVCAIMVIDEQGLDVAIAPQAWIVGRPIWQKGAGPGTKGWQFDCKHLEVHNGGGIPVEGVLPFSP